MDSQTQATRFLVTIDRDCRAIYTVDREAGSCQVAGELAQGLDPVIERALTEDARKWNRGLKTIRPHEDGWVVCDIFGVYRLGPGFEVRQYLSIPEFTDIHSAIPCIAGLLISNTGVDQLLLVDWSGKVVECIDFHRWYPATPWMANDLGILRREGQGDLRLLPLDWARESCHVNWAEETPLGLMASCFIQGEIVFFQEGSPVRRIAVGGKCHAPRFLKPTQTILYAASEEDRIAEVDLDGGEVWSMGGFRFPKCAEPLSGGELIIADTGNKRVVIVDRAAGRIVWECPVPGTPYDVQPWPGEQV